MNGPRFSTQEVALACRIPVSSVEHLARVGLAPPSEGGGRGASRRYPSQSVARLALVGAFYGAGLDMIPSARLANALFDEFSVRRGYFPDGMVDADKDRFLLQAEIERQFDDWHADKVQPRDFIIEIVDRTYVFSGSRIGMHANYRLDGWHRGATEVAIIHLLDDAGVLYSAELKTEAELAADREAEAAVDHAWNTAKQEAIAILRVNASLAVRRAFQALAKPEALA